MSSQQKELVYGTLLGDASINKIIGGFNNFGALNVGKVVPNFYARIQALETNGDLMFQASLNGSTGLYIYDGTSVSTVATSNASLPISYVSNLTEVDGVLYFTATDATNGTEWRKYENGIATLLADPNGTSASSIPTSASGNMIASYNGSVFFNANNGTNGYELWKYNGTTAYMVQDIEAGSGNSSPADMILYNDELHFTASTAALESVNVESVGYEKTTVVLSLCCCNSFLCLSLESCTINR